MEYRGIMKARRKDEWPNARNAVVQQITQLINKCAAYRESQVITKLGPPVSCPSVLENPSVNLLDLSQILLHTKMENYAQRS